MKELISKNEQTAKSLLMELNSHYEDLKEQQKDLRHSLKISKRTYYSEQVTKLLEQAIEILNNAIKPIDREIQLLNQYINSFKETLIKELQLKERNLIDSGRYCVFYEKINNWDSRKRTFVLGLRLEDHPNIRSYIAEYRKHPLFVIDYGNVDYDQRNYIKLEFAAPEVPLTEELIVIFNKYQKLID